MSDGFSVRVLSGFFITTIFALVLLQRLPIINGIGLAGVAGLAWFFHKEKLNQWLRTWLFLLLVSLAFWTATYKPQGFSYPLLMSLSDESGLTTRYELFVNFSKAICGFILLYFLWPKRHKEEFVAPARYQLLVALLAPAIIIGVAIPVLDLQVQLKQLEQILLFASANLLVICIAEEAFMRFLFQQNIRNAVARFTGNGWLRELIPLLLVTAIFVMIHSGLSGPAIWIYALAGFLYGLSYTLSKNIFYPIIIHFSVNQIHFSFFTYPL
ncbi:MAG TPA: CPBP family intramembrane glutamic endopeptidase [Cellvibrio sp.]|nr:CPBP family intramembrane glutamic endopeptidase [Cellvibrio sp.]